MADLINDKLVLLHKSNENENIVVKTASGQTERFNIQNKIMQGTVWSGLMCTTTMDNLCKIIQQEEQVLYKYRGIVSVPPLEMVDDVITASKCGSTTVALHTLVNSFMDSKKLKLSFKKCATIHIGNKYSAESCPDKYINNKVMNKSEKEKYLGDYISKSGNSKETIKSRKIRGNAIFSNMKAILQDIPLGRRRTQIGLVLRQSWFVNGVFFNSEVWSGYSSNDLNHLKLLDRKILRLITGAQAKVPVEMLYLETAQLPVENIISVRRLLYLKTILDRHESELIRQVYFAMKHDPLNP